MINNNKVVKLFGYASSIAAAKPGTENGPIVLQNSPYLSELRAKGAVLDWQRMLKPDTSIDDILENVIQQSEIFANYISDAVAENEFFMVIGGDHSSAIGTWSGVHNAISHKGPIGLIWIDAHMDSHTPLTSETGNIHGMPLACLLGQGHEQLINILQDEQKLKPEHVCLIGIRSYEKGEAELLKKLNVRYFDIQEIRTRGLADVFAEALSIVKKGTVGFGVSLDLDSIDPSEAPGTGVCEPDGLSGKELCEALKACANDSKLLGVEIVEFDPTRDKNQMTEKLTVQLMSAVILGE